MNYRTASQGGLNAEDGSGPDDDLLRDVAGEASEEDAWFDEYQEDEEGGWIEPIVDDREFFYDDERWSRD